MLALALSGCGDATNTDPGDDRGGGGSSFTVTPGSYIRRSTSGDGKISLTLTGVDMDLDRDSQPLIYFYDAKGYGGGRTTGGFQGDLRNFKLKYYGTHGEIESESYHGSRFRSTESYNIVLEWKTGNDGYVRSTINGSVFEKPGAVGESFTVGIGYPPAVRPGWDGAVYTNIVWPKGSKEVK
jgi:hypothetical protein